MIDVDKITVSPSTFHLSLTKEGNEDENYFPTLLGSSLKLYEGQSLQTIKA